MKNATPEEIEDAIQVLRHVLTSYVKHYGGPSHLTTLTLFSDGSGYIDHDEHGDPSIWHNFDSGDPLTYA